MRKGKTGVMILAVVSLIALGLVSVIAQGSAEGTLDFTRAQSVDLQAERVVNAMLVMETVPEGHVELQMSQYQVRYDQNDRNLSLNYSGDVGSKVLDQDMVSYQEIEGPVEFQPVNGSLCIQKEQENGGAVLTLNRTGCEQDG